MLLESYGWGLLVGLLVGLLLVNVSLFWVWQRNQQAYWHCHQRCQQAEAAYQTLRQQFQAQQVANRLRERLLQSSDMTSILQTATDELQAFLSEGCPRAIVRTVVYKLEGSWCGQFVAESFPLPYTSWVSTQVDRPELQQLGIWHKGQWLLTKAGLDEPMPAAPPHYVSDVTTQIAQAGNPEYYALLRRQVDPIYAYAVVPIFCGSQLWGLLMTYDHAQSRLWSASEQYLLHQTGQQLGKLLQQNQLLQQQQQQIQELQIAKEKEATANQSKSDFLAYMSHELRTPLNAILGFTQILQREVAPQLPAEHQQTVDIIERSGEHLLSLINDILDMSKIEAGQMALTEQSFDLHQLLLTLEDMLRLRAESKGLELTFEYRDETPQHIYADEQKLRQVLVNLLGNAIKFTQKGHVACRVWAESLDTSQDSPDRHNPIQLFIAIEDTGPGIDAEELDQLFKAFHQARSTRAHHEGTGLGLAISRRFVQMMDGKIGVISEPGNGSTFTVRIPCCWVTAKPKAVPVRIESTPAIAGQRYRVLVTDDDATSRLLLTKFLGSMGFDIKQACNGQEAVELWQAWRPHLIWMDIRMPLMDGCEATKHIKALDVENETVIIALTASAFEEQRQMMLASGCHDFVRKPFKREELLTKIRQYLTPAPAKPAQLPLHRSLRQAS